MTTSIISRCALFGLRRRRFFSSGIADKDRPDLYYHLVDAPPKPSTFALSFLPTPPPKPNSSTILGWIPAPSEAERPATLQGFKENPRFREVLHEAIRDSLRDGVDDIQTNGALQLQQGWMHIHDDRNIPPLGRIGDPDDILATVLVQDSKILPETYQPMPAYRLCTSDGPTKLTPGLAGRLLANLRTIAEAEKTT